MISVQNTNDLLLSSTWSFIFWILTGNWFKLPASFLFPGSFFCTWMVFLVWNHLTAWLVFWLIFYRYHLHMCMSVKATYSICKMCNAQPFHGALQPPHGASTFNCTGLGSLCWIQGFNTKVWNSGSCFRGKNLHHEWMLMSHCFGGKCLLIDFNWSDINSAICNSYRNTLIHLISM